MPNKLLHVRLRVGEIAPAERFFTRVLGMSESRQVRSPRGAELCFLSCAKSGVEIELCAMDDGLFQPLGPDQVHVAFQVEDLNRFRMHAGDYGYAFSQEPIDHGRERIAFIDGPGGCEIELIQELAVHFQSIT